MNLQWSKQFFLGPHCFKKLNFLVVSLASLCQLAKFFQPRILGDIGSPDKTVYVISNLLIQISRGRIFGRQFLWNIFLQTSPTPVQGLSTMIFDEGPFGTLQKLHFAMFDLIAFPGQYLTLSRPCLVSVCVYFDARTSAIQQTTLNHIVLA